MSDKDLENTKPIKVLSDLTNSRSDRLDTKDKDVSRSEKYEDVLLEDEAKIQEEIAEEALAEKNIALAEEIIHEEEKAKESSEESKSKKENKKELDDENDEITEEDGILGKLIVKWKSLTKKKKKLFGVGAVVVLLLVIILIIFLILKLTGNVKEDGAEVEQPVDVIPVVVDNFYYKEGTLYFLDDNENEIGSYECRNKDEQLCYVETNEYQDSFDVAKLVDSVGATKSQRMEIYDDNYVFVYDNSSETGTEVILYSIKENKEINKYLDVKAFDDNYVIVENTNELYGLIRIGENIDVIIEPQYYSLSMVDGEDNLIAKNKKGYVVINKKNKVLSSTFDSNLVIKNYNSNFVVALVSGEYVIYDYSNNLLDSGYDYITVYDKYMLLIDNNVLYIKDKDKNKYTEDGVKLSNKNYVKSYVYDENDQLKETKVSFEVNVKSNNIEVAVYPSTEDGDIKYTQLSIYEGLTNSKYNYVNYFNKKLYFYSDEDKTELLGSYTCSNENSLNSSDDSYTSCFVASDTITEDNDMVSEGDVNRKSTTPIINKRYVFISDGSNTINLYDIVGKKTKVTYLKVNTFTGNNDYQVTHYSGNKEVIVQTKSGKYGVIVFDGDSVSSKVAFEYNSLEKLGDYYLGLDTSNNYRILFNGSESVGFSNKIRGYNSTKQYYKVVEGGKYYIYDSVGTKVVNDSYTYVELYDTYYAAVDSNKEVSIYDYSGNKVFGKGIIVGNYKYYGADNPAFKVKKDGTKYVISIWDGSKYSDTVFDKDKESMEGSELPGQID